MEHVFFLNSMGKQKQVWGMCVKKYQKQNKSLLAIHAPHTLPFA